MTRTKLTASAATPPMTAKCLHGTPARKRIVNVMTTSTIPVPRSGCRKTSPAGVSPRARIRMVWRLGVPRRGGGGAAAGALDPDPGGGDDEQQLGQLRGLEAEVGELDPAAGAAGGGS